MTLAARNQFCTNIVHVLDRYDEVIRSNINGYLVSKKETDEYDNRVWDHLLVNVNQALGRNLNLNPENAVSLLGDIVENLTPDMYQRFFELFLSIYNARYLFKLCEHASNNDNALYAIATFFAVCKHKERTRRPLFMTVNHMTGVQMDPKLPVEQWNDAVTSAMFGVAWAALYPTREMAVADAIEHIFVQRPPLMHRSGLIIPVVTVPSHAL